ncbi:hypothetical protein GGX14DRAFT_411691 [Mycena pura]|uniref:Uncharacterized protein n=1 Tax=Mycena pura TaxID=153505 RepID=A0AAD7E647_9AGAR|nr:hypothetical protein GGX14DRAFT_411691 [Mycena pura]
MVSYEELHFFGSKMVRTREDIRSQFVIHFYAQKNAFTLRAPQLPDTGTRLTPHLHLLLDEDTDTLYGHTITSFGKDSSTQQYVLSELTAAERAFIIPLDRNSAFAFPEESPEVFKYTIPTQDHPPLTGFLICNFRVEFAKSTFEYTSDRSWSIPKDELKRLLKHLESLSVPPLADGGVEAEGRDSDADACGDGSNNDSTEKGTEDDTGPADNSDSEVQDIDPELIQELVYLAALDPAGTSSRWFKIASKLIYNPPKSIPILRLPQLQEATFNNVDDVNELVQELHYLGSPNPHGPGAPEFARIASNIQAKVLMLTQEEQSDDDPELATPGDSPPQAHPVSGKFPAALDSVSPASVL